MIYNGMFNSLLRKYTEYHIEGTNIVSSSESYESYNPFTIINSNTSRPIYLDFSELKTDEDILSFVRAYGFLGINRKYNLTTTSPFSAYIKNIKEESFEKYESIDNIRDQASLIRSVLKLIKAINTWAEDENLNQLIQETYKYNGRTFETDFGELGINGLAPRLAAQELVCLEINIKISNIGLIRYNASKSCFMENTQGHNLLTTIYMILFKDLVKGKKIVKCAYKNCPREFVIDGDDYKTQYCPDDFSNCSRNAQEKKRRENISMAKKLSKTGKSIEEISKIMKKDISVIENWINSRRKSKEV